MRQQQIVFELDNKLGEEVQDLLMDILTMEGAKNINIDYKE